MAPTYTQAPSRLFCLGEFTYSPPPLVTPTSDARSVQSSSSKLHRSDGLQNLVRPLPPSSSPSPSFYATLTPLQSTSPTLTPTSLLTPLLAPLTLLLALGAFYYGVEYYLGLKGKHHTDREKSWVLTALSRFVSPKPLVFLIFLEFSS